MNKWVMHIADRKQAADLRLILQKNEIKDLNISIPTFVTVSESEKTQNDAVFDNIMNLLKKNTSLRELGIYEIDPSKVASILEAISHNTFLESITFKVCRYDSRQIETYTMLLLLIGLKKIEHIKKLSLEIDSFWDPNGEKQIVTLLNDNTHLKALSISIDLEEIEDIYLGKDQDIDSFWNALINIRALDSVSVVSDSSLSRPLRDLTLLLKNKMLTSVEFENEDDYGFNDSEEDTESFCNALSRAEKLNAFSLVRLIESGSDTLKCIDTLMETVFSHQSIKLLDLSYNVLPWKLIRDIALKGQCNIRELNLSGTNLSDESMACLAESIINMKELRYLNLSECEFGDDGINNFCRILLENQKNILTEINFGVLCGKKTSIRAYEIIANFANQYPLSYLGFSHYESENYPDKQEEELNNKIISTVIPILQSNTHLKSLDLRRMSNKCITKELDTTFNFSVLLPYMDTTQNLSNQFPSDNNSLNISDIKDSSRKPFSPDTQQNLPFIESIGGSKNKRKKDTTDCENPNNKISKTEMKGP